MGENNLKINQHTSRVYIQLKTKKKKKMMMMKKTTL